MQKRRHLSRGLIYLLLSTILASVAYHTDLLGRVAYAFERGKLRADIEHLSSIDPAEIASLEQLSHAFSVVAGVVRPAVVNIEARSRFDVSDDDLRQLFRERGIPVPRDMDGSILLQPKKSTGSGVVIDDQGHIVTNNHVIEGAEVLEVTLADGRPYRAEVVGADSMTDIAVLKINADRLHPARFGDSDRMKTGNIVLAIGSPFRLGHSVSHGIISALGRTTQDVDIDYQNWIQTDAAINPGNSGGPLINTRGEVIAITTAIATENGGHQGVGFAIPANTVTRVAQRLMDGVESPRGYLGVTITQVDPDIADAYGLDSVAGVFVGGVGPDSPAAKGDLEPEDIIQAIDGKKIVTLEQLQATVAATKPGTDVQMKVWRDGAPHSLTIPIGAQPKGFSTTGSLLTLLPPTDEDEDVVEEEEDAADEEDEALDGADDEDADTPSETEIAFDSVGFTADTLSPKLARRFGIGRSIESGALITHTSPTGEAYAEGLRRGHVITRANGRRINDIRELEQIMSDAAIAKGVRLTVEQTVEMRRFGKRVRKSVVFYAVLRVR